MKNIVVLWLVVFILSSLSIGYTHELVISPIWIINIITAYYLIQYRKVVNSTLFTLLFSFSSVFIASYLFDKTKPIDFKILLSVIGAVQVVIFMWVYYWIAERASKFKYYHTVVFTFPNIISSDMC